jgi:ABC-type sugar transport system permease subunit
MDKIIGTIVGVVAAIGISGIIFVGVNMLFDAAPKRWSIFTTLLGAGTGLFVFLVLWGNRIVENPIYIAVGAVVGGVVGYLLSVWEGAQSRLLIGVGGGAALGVLAGIVMVETSLPEFDPVALVVWPIAGAVLGAAIWQVSHLPGRTRVLAGMGLGAGLGVALGVFAGGLLAVVATAILGAVAGALLTETSRTSLLRPVLLFATLGWVIGAFLVPSLGTGTRLEAIIAAGVLGAGAGALVGITQNPGDRRRDEIARGSRAYIFLTPAIAFISLSLVIPTVRTIILSFKDVRGDAWVGGDNYQAIFTDPTIFKIDDWRDIFSSAMFWWGLVLLVVGLIVGRVLGRRTGHRMEFSGGTVPPMALGVFLLSFAVFATLRGTIFNNLWWVFTVTILATSLGLAIAVLADRARFESVAKSIIFLPMAISFVGAGIIWRFMYIARPPNKTQTGVMNAMWVGLGKLSHTDGPRYIVVAVLLLIVLGLAYLGYRGWKAGAMGLLTGTIVTALPLLWVVYRFIGIPGLVDPLGLGGFAYTSAGEVEADTILFLQTAPFNNVWLMVVLIWIQTGFSMVIFSAAIKGVPNDLIEAAKVDGATESQTFWRVIIPQIATTIGVVVTTLIVLVMKVFDIVKVMTNGNFDTQVLANEMWQRAFTEFNFGLGAAVAIVLFVSVLPVMYINIRRMQKAAA